MTVQTAPPTIDLATWNEWRSQNPFRVWKQESGTTYREAAALLKCSITMVQLYESGIHPFPDDKIELAAPHMGIQAKTLRRKLRTWEKADPRAD